MRHSLTIICLVFFSVGPAIGRGIILVMARMYLVLQCPELASDQEIMEDIQAGEAPAIMDLAWD